MFSASASHPWQHIARLLLVTSWPQPMNRHRTRLDLLLHLFNQFPTESNRIGPVPRINLPQKNRRISRATPLRSARRWTSSHTGQTSTSLLVFEVSGMIDDGLELFGRTSSSTMVYMYCYFGRKYEELSITTRRSSSAYCLLPLPRRVTDAAVAAINWTNRDSK